MNRRLVLLAGLVLCLAGGALLLLGWRLAGWSLPWGTALEPPSAEPWPLVPTRTPGAAGATPPPTAQPPAPSSSVAPPDVAETYWQGRPRWGVGVAQTEIAAYDLAPLRLGWYLDWWARVDPPAPDGVEYVRMVWGTPGDLRPSVGELVAIAVAHPGSLWLVGNEPDVTWQGNMDPETYARFYHEAYEAIRAVDPSARIAIGGISQPTPLRLRYLDRVLASYETQFGAPMPVDVWNVHNFILREEEDGWGVGIPPGLSDEGALRYEIEDVGNLDIFRRQIVDFRRWMAERGYRNYPLIVSEYGIPMPEDYGFPPERVSAFLLATFDFFLTAADPALGYPADGDRLVQRWCWYSLADTAYPTGNLFDPETGSMTAVGSAWAEYVGGR